MLVLRPTAAHLKNVLQKLGPDHQCHFQILLWNAQDLPLRTFGADEMARMVVPCKLVLVSVYEIAILPAFSQLLEGAAIYGCHHAKHSTCALGEPCAAHCSRHFSLALCSPIKYMLAMSVLSKKA